MRRGERFGGRFTQKRDKRVWYGHRHDAHLSSTISSWHLLYGSSACRSLFLSCCISYYSFLRFSCFALVCFDLFFFGCCTCYASGAYVPSFHFYFLALRCRRFSGYGILGIRTGLSAQWRRGHTLDLVVRPNKLRNVCGAGIGAT